MEIARCRKNSAGNHRWHLRFDESLNPDIIIAAPLQPGNGDIPDYYLMPRSDILRERLNLKLHNGLIWDVYRFQNLGPILFQRLHTGNAVMRSFAAA
jgi:hypothetical protein